MQSTHKHHPALGNRRNKHSFTFKSLLDVDKGEKEGWEQQRYCIIHHLTFWQSPAKDTAGLKPRLPRKLHSFPRADTRRLAIRKIIWSYKIIWRLVEKFIIGCMSKQNHKTQTSNLALLQITWQSKDRVGFPGKRPVNFMCLSVDLHNFSHV